MTISLVAIVNVLTGRSLSHATSLLQRRFSREGMYMSWLARVLNRHLGHACLLTCTAASTGTGEAEAPHFYLSLLCLQTWHALYQRLLLQIRVVTLWNRDCKKGEPILLLQSSHSYTSPSPALLRAWCWGPTLLLHPTSTSALLAKACRLRQSTNFFRSFYFFCFIELRTLRFFNLFAIRL
jgi:hypothetical protein